MHVTSNVQRGVCCLQAFALFFSLVAQCTVLAQQYQFDYVVVGAGIAGAGAASTLKKAGKSVVVLEARNRVGGRLLSESVDGWIVNLGASWIHGQTGNPITSLAKSANVELSKGISQYDNQQMYYADGKTVPAASEARYDTTWAEFEKYLAQRQEDDYEEDDPGLQPVIDDFVRKKRLQGQDLEAFRYGIKANIEDEYAGPTLEMSLYFDEDKQDRGGDRVVVGRYDDIVKYLLRQIPVRLSAKVTKIDYSSPIVAVTAGPNTYKARKAVIVTVPLGVLKADSIRFIPSLPDKNRKAIAGLGMGLLNKCVMIFESSFWGSDEEWIERITSSGFQSTLSMTPVARQPVLYGFNSATNARKIESWTDAKTCDTLMTALRAIWPNAPTYRKCLVTRWGKDPYSYGSYSYTTKRMEYNKAHKGVGSPVAGGRLSFAGEATSLDFPATVHGAYNSGVATAEKLLR